MNHTSKYINVRAKFQNTETFLLYLECIINLLLLTFFRVKLFIKCSNKNVYTSWTKKTLAPQ